MRTRDTNTLIIGYLAVCAFVVAASLSWIRLPELLWLDSSFRVLRASKQPAETGAFVVVGLDDASLREFGVPVATLHHQIGRFFQALAIGRPEAVGVDIVLPEISYDAIQPGLDAALARGILALRNVAPLVIGVGAQPDGSQRPLHPLYASLAGDGGTGSVFVLKDADGMFRRFDEAIGERGQHVQTLAGQIVRRLGKEPVDGLLPWHKLERLTYIPLREVLAWHAAGDRQRLQQAFGGKIVLLGSLLAHDDQHRVPLAISVGDPAEQTHGVFIHAQQVASQLSHRLIAAFPAWGGLAGSVLFTLFWFLPPSKARWLLVAGLTLGILLTSIITLHHAWSIPALTWCLALLSSMTARTGWQAWLAAAERRRLRRAFGGFVSPSVLQEILAGRLHPQLSGERRDVCVLFSDIRSFTTLSEGMAPEAITTLLNRYFERMASVIHRHGGTLDKFIGDGIMAFFGAPQTLDNPCANALAAAREMLVELEEFNREQVALQEQEIAIGVGLHYGPALIGYIGARERNEYSAIGDTVNVASRLEGLTKELGCPIVVSSAVQERLAQNAGLEYMGEKAVKGHTAIAVYGCSHRG